MLSDGKLHIRDGRKRDRYSIDHVIFRQRPDHQERCWAALIKPAGMAVYNAIVHHADYNSQESYPSFSTLARETGMSLSQAKREVKKLAEFQMITVVPPGDERKSNTYVLTDTSTWTLPENYIHDYASNPRSDKGKSNPKRSHKKTGSRVTETPEVVSHRHQEASVTETPGAVSDRHQGRVSETPGVVSDRHPNNTHMNTTQLPIPTTNTKQSASEDKNSAETTPASDRKTVDVVGAAINDIFSQQQREERITEGNLKKISTLHELQSAEEILKAVRSLASKDFYFGSNRLGNVIGFLIGKKNGDSQYHSNCFFDGVCSLPEPEASPERRPQPLQEDEIDWHSIFEALPAAEQQKFQTRAEQKLVSHKHNMAAETYRETLRVVTIQEFIAAAPQEEN